LEVADLSSRPLRNCSTDGRAKYVTIQARHCALIIQAVVPAVRRKERKEKSISQKNNHSNARKNPPIETNQSLAYTFFSLKYIYIISLYIRACAYICSHRWTNTMYSKHRLPMHPHNLQHPHLRPDLRRPLRHLRRLLLESLLSLRLQLRGQQQRSLHRDRHLWHPRRPHPFLWLLLAEFLWPRAQRCALC
jgi:hypothetical protein